MYPESRCFYSMAGTQQQKMKKSQPGWRIEWNDRRLVPERSVEEKRDNSFKGEQLPG